MKQLLIVWHSRTGAAQAMAAAAASGAADIAQQLGHAAELRVVLQAAADTRDADLLASDGFLFCAPENLASLSGEMKEFFDRCYYGVLDHIEGRPYACIVSAGTDGSGAARQVERICTGWRLAIAAPALILRSGAQTPAQILAPKHPPEADLKQCETQGGLLAALLLIGQ